MINSLFYEDSPFSEAPDYRCTNNGAVQKELNHSHEMIFLRKSPTQMFVVGQFAHSRYEGPDPGHITTNRGQTVAIVASAKVVTEVKSTRA